MMRGQTAGTGRVETLIGSLVADLDVVYRAYEGAGLLSDAGSSSLAPALLGGGEAADRFRREVLMVDALLRQRVARLVFGRHGPRHIAVFGGNNVGKSTVINILAGAAIASTSPEGGHTQNAQAFSASALPLFSGNPYAFSRLRLVPADRLNSEGHDCYSIVPRVGGVLADDVVLWDVPDCDAVGSGRYVAAVVEAVCGADLVVYVTSIEKYSVLDLVEWLFEVNDAGIPILACLNKTPKKDRVLVQRKQADDVFPAVSKRLNLPAPTPRVVALRYMIDGEEADLWGPDHPEATELRQAALAGLSAQNEAAEAQAALRSISRRMERLLEPARTELSVKGKWQSLVRTAVAGFVTTYEDEYLSGGSVMVPFQQLNGELLELLNPDIPYLGAFIGRLRSVQRLPNRVLKAAARGVFDFVSDSGRSASEAKPGPQMRAYTSAHRAILRTLQRQIDAEQRAPRHHPFWDQLAKHWERQVATLTDEFDRSAAAQLEMTNSEITEAARDILRALQQRPNVLKLFKAARVSADVGGLLVGFLIPGHGGIIHDLLDEVVIAPAMLTAVGATAEMAVEGYVATRRDQVVEKLRANARAMAAVLYFNPLEALGDAAMAGTGRLGIAQDLLDRIPADLARLQQAIVGQPAGADA